MLTSVSTAMVLVSVVLIEVFKNDRFPGVWLLVFNLEAEYFLESGLVCVFKRVWEDDFKHHKESAIFVALLVEGHSLVLDHLNLAGLNDLAGLRLHFDHAPV